MKKWLVMSLAAAYAGLSANAAVATSSVWSGPAASIAAAQVPLADRPNFDASLRSVSVDHRAKPEMSATMPETVIGALRYQRLLPASVVADYVDPVLKKPTFVWAGKEAGKNFIVFRSGEGAQSYARSYLRQFAPQLGMMPEAVDQARMVFVHDDNNGPVIVRYQQVEGGHDVMNRQINVIMDQNLDLVAISGYFASTKDVDANHAADAFDAGPQRAMRAALADLGVHMPRYDLQKRAENGKGGFELFAPAPGRQATSSIQLAAPVGAKAVLFPADGELVPAWLMTLQVSHAGDSESASYAYVISLDGSRSLYRKNLTADAAYTYRVFANTTTQKPDDSPFGNSLMPYPGDGNVNETVGVGTLVDVAVATQGVSDPWLPVPVAGMPTDETTGNNVFAYADVAGNDGQDDSLDISATTTAPGVFDYTFDSARQPNEGQNQSLAIVNLFYLNNWLHDAWYNAGFTEAAGNAQYVNYGRGGAEGDPILAEAQDFSGRNNSNMSTPPDGFSPRQQMFIFDGPTLSQTTIATSAGGATFAFDPAYPAGFGPREFDVDAPLIIYDDGDESGVDGSPGSVHDACQPTTQNLAGKIAFITDIYTCRFDAKVANAEAAGAIGAVIVWNDGGDTDNAFHMGGDNIASIPSVGVSDQDANPVIATVDGGETVTLHMAVDNAPDRDGSLDTQIVAHEFFHYVSNRLVGNALGLSNAQGAGMGEGWSDMAALLLTARADDLAAQPAGAYTVGGYAVDNFASAIRAFPYSTDMSLDPLTFRYISLNPEVHFVGTVWASMLWEAYVALYEHYQELDPSAAYTIAKSKMMNYIIEGLMGTPNAPTMVEARDGILAAAYATSRDDYNIFVRAFAKRGMGWGAVAPDRNSASLAGVKESYETNYKSFGLQSAVLDVNAVGVCDADYSLDPGETGTVKLVLLNTGSADLTGITAQLSSTFDIAFANGGLVTFQPDTLPTLGGTVTATTTATVRSASATSQPMTIKVSFPQVGGVNDDVHEPVPIQFQFVSNQDLELGRDADDLENRLASLYDWTRTRAGGSTGWVVNAQFNVPLGLPAGNHYWWGPDNDSPSDVALITPPVVVGSNPFSVSFYHYYQFEDGGYDGGVVEITTDGGATWQDVTAVGGQFDFGYNGTIGPYNTYLTPGRAAFVNAGGTAVDRGPEVIRFGTALAGKTVQIRFRIGSDPAGGQIGWIVDDITVEGASKPVFSVTVPEDKLYCGDTAPTANAGDDQTVSAGTMVKLDGSKSMDPEGEITFHWTQTAGSAMAMAEPTTAKPMFKAPYGPGTYEFQLTVTDAVGHDDSDSVAIAVTDDAPDADAGPDQSVDAASRVTLDGAGSADAEGSISYEWKQVSGPSITLRDANSANPSFTAPNGAATLSFQLTVTDEGNQVAFDTATVAVRPQGIENPAASSDGGTGSTGVPLLGLFALSILRRRRTR